MSLILYPPKTSIAFTLFNFPIYFYGIIMVSAIFLGIILSYFLIKKRYSKACAELFLDFIPMVIIFSILGARLFYILGNLNYYILNPLEIIFINHGGLSFWGGLTFGTLSFLFFLKKNKLPLSGFFDSIAVTLPLSQAIGRWGNYFNQEAYGAPYDGFLKMFVDLKHRPIDYINFEYFHPAFLYESVLNLILFVFLLVLFLKKKNLKSGTIFYLYLICYSIIRIIVESIRIDSVLDVFNMPVAMVISFIVLISGIILILKNKKAA